MMVRRRKQLKPRGAGRDKPEPGVTLTSSSSPLVALPVEIQGIITSHLVQLRDLNHFCCTCKTLSAVVLPILYHTIELKVPLRWSGLPALENLLASSSEGLKYTRSLKIVAKQYGQEDNKYFSLDEECDTDDEEVIENTQESSDDVESESEGEGEEADGIFRFDHPDDSASNMLNAFIRVLIVKLLPQQLDTFWWEHASSLNPLTLSILLKHQGASIRTLNFKGYTRKWAKADLANLTIGSLTTLGMTELGVVDSLTTELLARNHTNLRHLRLGNEADLAKAYANSGSMDSDEVERFCLTKNFGEIMKQKVAVLHEHSTPEVQLESLSLIGLNLGAFTQGLIEPLMDFGSLSALTLESCVGLEAAFPLLVGAGTDERSAKSALRLHTLAIRQESISNECLQALEIFLVSLKPLTHLHLLLEGDYNKFFDLSIILRVHGERLRTLVFDERSGPRGNIHEDTSSYPNGHKNLKLVAKHCSALKALGISLDWEDISGFKKNHKDIASSFSRLSQLQTLNIRNLPAALTSKSWLPNDYLVEGLAAMLLNIVTKNAQIEQALVLRTLAIGASTYGNVRMGMSDYTPNNASTFLELRIYHVNYDCRYRNSLSPKLHLIAGGTPADAWGNAEHLEIFTLYWLDGVSQDSKRCH